MKHPSIRLTFFTVALAIAGIALVGGVAVVP